MKGTKPQAIVASELTAMFSACVVPTLRQHELLGWTYQELIREAVRVRGNGEKGLAHIRGSLKKWPHILEILSAPKGEELSIKHDFSKGKGTGKPEHRAKLVTGHPMSGRNMTSDSRKWMLI
jgi:hypothetical protein